VERRWIEGITLGAPVGCRRASEILNGPSAHEKPERRVARGICPRAAVDHAGFRCLIGGSQMTRRVWTLAVCLGLWFGPTAMAQQIPVVEHRLPNGFKLLLVERHEEPRIAGGWVAHVGSANERPGITGIAHLFEHMMFKGTPTIGCKDPQKDLEILAEQERVRDEMRAEEASMRAGWRRGEVGDWSKAENQTPRYKELQAKFQKLVDAERELLVKNEFDRVYTSGGASHMNAFTSEDMTGYFITVPANKLELWCWMESERLFHPIFREFYSERDVVFEERRMRTESTPTGKFNEQFMAKFWDALPYHWPVIGWPSDIPAISKRQADDFYALYYQPQNITLILVGDFKSEEALAMASRYFGRIPAGTAPPPEVTTTEIESLAEMRYNAEAETNPEVDILWHTVGFGHKDGYALDVLGEILSHRTGRLYKGLVLGRQVATDVSAGQSSRKWSGLFEAGAEVRDGHAPAEVEAAIDEEIDRLKKDLVPAEELQKVKNQAAAAEYRKLSANFAIFMQLLHAEGMGDWREVNEEGRRVQAVTAEDVRRVASTYLVRENRAVATYTRKGGSAPADPELAALSPEQQKMLRPMLESLHKETDTGKLEQQIQQIEGRPANPDPQRAQLRAFFLKKAREHLAELQKK
jgi:predicted Zn-dependent peptidase